MDYQMDGNQQVTLCNKVTGRCKHFPYICFISTTHHPTEAVMQNAEPQGSSSSSNNSRTGLNCGSM